MVRDDEGSATMTQPWTRLHLVPAQPDHNEATGGAAVGEPVLWFVTVTVSGPESQACDVREALERLSVERPFVVSARYAADRAEVTYWDESDDIAVAAAQGLRMWSDHASTARLPDWHVVGLEVVDRDTARLRRDRFVDPQLRVLGEIRPYEQG